VSASDESRLRYQWGRVSRHLHWARTEGIGKLIEEDQLDPVRRASLAWDRWRWVRSEHPERGRGTAVFLVGVQRSGTNMMLQGLESCPQIEVHNENDRRAFDRYRLKPEAVRPIVAASRCQLVLFKPLCDSQDVVRVLDDPALVRPAKAIWAVRSVDGRVRSSVAKFGDANRQALADIAATGLPNARWEAGGLDEPLLDLVRGLDPAKLTAESASALFWYLRNDLYFRLGLDQRPDVTLARYDDFVQAPEPSMRALCDFLEFPYADRLIKHIDARTAGRRPPLEIDPRVRALCDELTARVDATTTQRTGGPAH